VLRETTEWPATLEAHGGRSVLVGRDPVRAVAALARLAPAADAVRDAEARAMAARVEPSGAAGRISAVLGTWLHPEAGR